MTLCETRSEVKGPETHSRRSHFGWPIPDIAREDDRRHRINGAPVYLRRPGYIRGFDAF
jgi:hypothetical protein